MKWNKQFGGFQIYAILWQIPFLFSCTIWNKIVIIPPPVFRPPVTKEYWNWFLDRGSVMTHEAMFVSTFMQVKWISFAAMSFAFLCLLFKKKNHKKINAIILSYLCIALFLCTMVFCFNRKFGQPYYLYMATFTVEIMSLTYLAVLAVLRRKSESENSGK